MANRVLIREGQLPLLVVAPHGNQDDDQNTDIIADVIASEMNAYYVINIGWRRAAEAVLGEGIANLNNIKHCQLIPCKQEFLDQIIEFKNNILTKSKRAHILYVHGMSNAVRRKTNDNVDIVIGYGQGQPPSYSCNLYYKTAFVVRMQEEKFNVYQGKAGGRFSGWKHDNLNQFFRRYQQDDRVQSVQIEIVNALRYNIEESINTAKRLARALDNLLHMETGFRKGFTIKEY